MAKRRMFSRRFILADKFQKMSPKAKCLYIVLCMMADDDGFVDSPDGAILAARATEADLEVLIEKQFVIQLDSEIVVIRHWNVHNKIQKDRYSPTEYLQERAQLIKQKDDTYALIETVDSNRIQSGSMLDPQDSVEEDRVVKASEVKKSAGKHSGRAGFTPPTVEEVQAYCRENHYTFDAKRFVEYYTGNGWMTGMKPMADWKETAQWWNQNEGSSFQRRETKSSGGVFFSRMNQEGCI